MTTRRKRRDERPVCQCDAYPFPHRKGGGRCDGNDTERIAVGYFGWLSATRQSFSYNPTDFNQREIS